MRHQNLDERIAELAKELDLPVENVKEAYLETLRDLTAGARVHDYLHVFVVKRVMALLRSARPND
ncbi:DUF3562 domain-containing protein [Cupriavidus sp. WKF15]|uniref:DUF3562 domain-containing protein n=1 Tax=Cupriavidus sp. WKF15 TaxID=3032282 RepID=UPI0023E0E94D|nr:DUF3562 domain-containing protein [Cupriavidus sp. WKF15]WER49940.1 DUF3562 domain-containing protein [Cupriavidus sp. WKF15]